MKWEVGMGVEWENFRGDKFEGVVIEIDSNVLIVQCTDGKKRAVESGE